MRKFPHGIIIKSAALPVLMLAVFMLPLRSQAASVPPGVRTAYAYGERYLMLADLCRIYNLQIQNSRSSVKVYSKYNTLVMLKNNRRYAMVNNYKVSTAYPLLVRKGIAYISSADHEGVLNPLIRPYTVPKQSKGLIVLDPGHGGKDRGAERYGVVEKKITQLLAAKTAAILRKKGYQVLITRRGDYQLPLPQRPAAANAARGTLFISFHINAAANRTITGAETFCLTQQGEASSNAAGSKGSEKRHTGNRFDSSNILLAGAIHRQILKNTGMTDRGIKRARFAVLRDLNCPGVLLECGFVSNPAEARNINSAAFQNKIAEAVAAGIDSYFSTVKPLPRKKQTPAKTPGVAPRPARTRQR